MSKNHQKKKIEDSREFQRIHEKLIKNLHIPTKNLVEIALNIEVSVLNTNQN